MSETGTKTRPVVVVGVYENLVQWHMTAPGEGDPALVVLDFDGYNQHQLVADEFRELIADTERAIDLLDGRTRDSQGLADLRTTLAEMRDEYVDSYGRQEAAKPLDEAYNRLVDLLDREGHGPECAYRCAHTEGCRDDHYCEVCAAVEASSPAHCAGRAWPEEWCADCLAEVGPDYRPDGNAQ